MQPVSARFLAALRGAHTMDVRVEAWRGGVQVGGTLDVVGGQVTAEASLTASPRRSLSVELAPARGLWDALAPAGTTLYAWRGIRFVDGTTERVPLGVFDVDEQSLGYGPDGTLTLTAPDLWVRVQRARFEPPRSINNGVAAVPTAVALATEATGTSAGAQTADLTATTKQQFTHDRDDLISAISLEAGAWVYADVDGRIISRPVPTLYSTPVWTVDASASGVLLDASRTRNRQRTYNVVVLSDGSTDGTGAYAPVTVADNDPASLTWVGGSFGRVPYYVATRSLSTTAQATTYGKSLLRRLTGLAAQLSLTSVVNPALEPGDVIQVLLPTRDGDPAKVERHLIDSVTIPLVPEDAQTISTRSSRPEGDVTEGI